MLKEKGIRLKAKPLGRPLALSIHVSPGERNPIEGKFGQAKTAYGLDRLGMLRIILKSDGVDSPEMFNCNLIRHKKLHFTPSVQLKKNSFFSLQDLVFLSSLS